MAKTAQSAELLELKGRKPDASRAAGPAFEGGRPTMPKTLTGHAKQEWRRLVRELVRRGTSTRLDAGILEVHCLAYQRFHAALAEIGDKLFVSVPVQDAAGNVFFKRAPNPALPILEKAEAVLKQTYGQLGATPASRKIQQMTKEGRAKNQPPKPGTAAAMLAAAEGE